MWCWMNGEYVQSEDLRISPFDHGFLYGLGFFETFRTYGEDVFLWEEHCKRLQHALDDYHIVLPYSFVELLTVIRELDERSDGEDGYFRLNVSAGPHDIGLKPTSYTEPTVIIFRKSLPKMIRGQEKSAVWLNTKRNSPEQAIRHKSHHYANNVLARFEMPSLVEQEGFFVNAEGFVAEGITSNIFWVKDGEIYTPSIETGILPGITRQQVMQQVAVVEGFYTPEQLESADECFITTSIQELIPIRLLQGKNFLGNTGPVYKALHEQYVKSINDMKGRS
ncbi:aminodeoxychorismate lyase [Viridibacillus sp. YIM B01967]|uniref:Aminodeoxychorismate lyase n=1 Tax=Viridibacillus soli TaxID=2798301 RepID=A0ABS1HBS7_9BACL|nr:aminodeoxychorismate lyase [Viridibacillus soli]MBK3496895.1 aminodeoxychorismate lyase [Viridibacillus soli]